MKPNISEFSFGFALTSELVNEFGLQTIGAPAFLTQNAEGAPGGGYDVQLPGLPVFLQFKRSECLTTRNALDHSALGIPYYRFMLSSARHSDQHQLLIELENLGNIVLYAAPRFHQPYELDSAFIGQAVTLRTSFFAPADIGPLPDLDEHSISFKATNETWAILRSEPRRIDQRVPDRTFTAARREHPSLAWKEPTTFKELGDQLVEIYADSSSFREQHYEYELREASRSRSGPEYARYAALTLFGAELMLLPHFK